MPREPRLHIAGATHHVVHRGNHRERVFFDDADCRDYLQLLALMSARYETRVHAYVVMSNHVHLLMTPERPDGVSRTIQHTASGYSRGINDRLGRKGTLWEGRFRSSLIASDFYCLACYRYIEMNPVRAGMVASPADYRWSSHLENVGRRSGTIIEPHASYLALARSREERHRSYQALFEEDLTPLAIATIRIGTRKGLPIRSADGIDAARPGNGATENGRRRGRPRNPDWL